MITEFKKKIGCFRFAWDTREGLIDNLRAATGDVADDLMTYLQANEVPILACIPCAKARRVSEDDLIEGVRMAAASELIKLACDATVISL